MLNLNHQLINPSYPEDDIPVFFGHYWQEHEPVLQQQNLCCVDYSAGIGGDLVCFRFENPIDGRILDAERFEWYG